MKEEVIEILKRFVSVTDAVLLYNLLRKYLK
jgi:hypothetical protein